MARRPTVRGDRNNWGEVLNAYLNVSLDVDGTLKDAAVPRAALTEDIAEQIPASIGGARQIIKRKQLVAEVGWFDVPYLDSLDFYESGDADNYALSVARAITEINTNLNGRGEIVLPNRAEAYSGAQISFTSNITIRGAGSNTEMVVDDTLTNGRLFNAAGTIGTRTALDANQPAGSFTVTLPSGGGAAFSVGDLIELRSSLIVHSTARARDVRKVIAIAGDVLTLDMLIIFNFNTADSATYARIVPIRDAALRDFLISNADSATNTGYAARWLYGENNSIQDVTIKDGGGGWLLEDQLAARVDRPIVDGLPNGWFVNASLTGFGYGVILAGATSKTIVTGLVAAHTRHAQTTIAQQDTGLFYGGPRDCEFIGAVSSQADSSGLGTSHFDTHDAGWNTLFAHCLADGGGEAGFQDRAVGTRYIGCVARRTGSRGFNIATLATDTTVEGGGAYDCGADSAQTGITVGAPNSRVVGFESLRNSAAGLGINANNVLVEGGRYADNVNYGIQYIAGTTPIVRGPVIPQSATQTIAILAMPTGSTTEGVIALGYSADATAFFTFNADARVRNCVTSTDGVRNIATSETLKPETRVWRGNPTAGNITVTLPAAANHVGRVVQIINIHATNSVIVDGNSSEVISGPGGAALTKTITTQYGFMTIVATATSWDIIAMGGTIT